MPAAVTYWTGIWEPRMEAISSEVETLRRMDGRLSPVVSFSSGQRTSVMTHGRVVRLSGTRWMTLRMLAAVIERCGNISHVFGAVNAWHLLRALGRRPILHTVVLTGPALDCRVDDKVRLFAAESETLVAELRDAGVPDDKIRLVYPGIDLQRFVPGDPPSGRFRVLFASTPANVEEFAQRGIPVIVAAARACPSADFVLLWRRWGDGESALAALRALDPPRNVLIDMRDVRDMAQAYRCAHATICMFDEGFGKSCPNSVIEGLASGLPAIVSTGCGIAELVASSGAGRATPRDGQAVAEAIENIRDHYPEYSAQSRGLAERCFSLERFERQYRALYGEIFASR